MRKLILLALLLVPSVGVADQLPAGCYVADYYRTDPCWAPSDNYLNWNYYSSRAEAELVYGSAVEIIINTELANKADADACGIAYGLLSGNYNGKVGQIKSKDKLISKLRKACGRKCKKIK